MDQALVNSWRQEKVLHKHLMREQENNSKRRSLGEKKILQRKWPIVVSKTKLDRAQTTSRDRLQAVSEARKNLMTQRNALGYYKPIKPRFGLMAPLRHGRVFISEGSVAYQNSPSSLVFDSDISLEPGDKIGLQGNNGSGKSTVLKAIKGDGDVRRAGTWVIPESIHVGCFDQHYASLNPEVSLAESTAKAQP